jgi:hypothetical protein
MFLRFEFLHVQFNLGQLKGVWCNSAKVAVAASSKKRPGMPELDEVETKPTPALPRLAYSMRETAKIIGVNYQTVYRLNKRGLLRSSTALRTKLFARCEIERFLKSTLPA